MQEIMIWMRNLLLFHIVSTICLNCVPKGGYVRYVKIVVGVIFMLLFLEPAVRIFAPDNALCFEQFTNGSWWERTDLRTRAEWEEIYENQLCSYFAWNKNQVLVRCDGQGEIRKIRIRIKEAEQVCVQIKKAVAEYMSMEQDKVIVQGGSS